MTSSFRELIEAWDGMAVVFQYDRETNNWIFVALHSDALGIPVGGTRMMVYPSHEDGLRSALRLAEGMTRKWASTDVPFGGGKAVVSSGATSRGRRARPTSSTPQLPLALSPRKLRHRNRCGGVMKILAFITEPGVIRTILDHRDKTAAVPTAPPLHSSP